MKRVIALAIIGMLLMSSALAAEWPEGCSPAQPYTRMKEVDLTQTMGYIILFPRPKVPASTFCDILEIYLPREDIVIGEGQAHLFDTVNGTATEIDTITFGGEESRTAVRKLSETELGWLMWGSGVCVEIPLTKSLEFGEHSYYVTMDEGCFKTEDGTLPSVAISNPEAWQPMVQGDYGISGLFYTESEMPAPEPTKDPEEMVEEEAEEGAEAEEAESAGPDLAAEAANGTMTVKPGKGDIISFDLVLGGDATLAIIYSENDSVSFEQVELTESGHVNGRVIDDEARWGVVFLDAEGQVLEAIDLLK